MHPGAFVLGEAGRCYECGHEHSVGDRCVSFSFVEDYFDEIRAAHPAAAITDSVTPLCPRRAACSRLRRASARSARTIRRRGGNGRAVAFAAVTTASGNRAQAGPVSTRDEKRVVVAMRYIEENASEEIGLDRLAVVAGVSKFHFLRIFARVAQELRPIASSSTRGCGARRWRLQAAGAAFPRFPSTADSAISRRSTPGSRRRSAQARATGGAGGARPDDGERGQFALKSGSPARSSCSRAYSRLPRYSLPGEGGPSSCLSPAFPRPVRGSPSCPPRRPSRPNFSKPPASRRPGRSRRRASVARARRRARRRSVLFETGYGPSGLPHIGTFGEVARTTMVRRAFRIDRPDPDPPARLLRRHGRPAQGAGQHPQQGDGRASISASR